MRYKVENKESPVIVNNTEKNYFLRKTEDVIELRFDEENQAFFARIKNPSEHTKYLYENNKLAIALCKMNCGKETLHGHYCKHESYITPTGDERDDPSSFVKRNKHPRWSRCGKNIAPVLDNLDDEYEIDITQTQRVNGETYAIGIDDFYPEPRHTVGNKWNEKWYNSVKAVLLSSPIDLTNGSTVTNCRAYRTMCKRIKIEYDSENNIIIHRKKRNKSQVTNRGKYWLDANVAQNGYEFIVTITGMSPAVQAVYEDDRLTWGIECEDVGRSHRHGGRASRGKNGDVESESYEYQNRRWRYRSKEDCGGSNHQRISINNDYIEDLDNLIINLNSIALKAPLSMANLFDLINNHNKDVISITKPLNLVLMMKNEISVDERHTIVWRYQTNINITFSSDGGYILSLV